MPLSQDRNTPSRDAEQFEFPVAAGAVCYAGGIAVLNGTWVQPGTTATGHRAVGVFEARADNTGGAAGAIRARVRRGCFRFKNSAADEITLADVGNNCFIVDDETVARTNGSNTRSIAGVIRDVDAQGVWVQF